MASPKLTKVKNGGCRVKKSSGISGTNSAKTSHRRAGHKVK